MIAALELDPERAAVREAVAARCRGRGAGAFDAAGWRELAGLGVLAVGVAAAGGVQELVAACAALGAPALLAFAPVARVQQLWLQSLWETIGGGTSEVMRGVVARQALGLGGRG